YVSILAMLSASGLRMCAANDSRGAMMKVIEEASWLRHELAAFRHERIALVPTMGCLHEGHISLIHQAKKLADVVVVSIYVNPLQFGANEDLAHYPRPFAEDARRCQAEGVNFLFHPTKLYDDAGPAVTLRVAALADGLCGAHRSGHFDGVATVVNLLLNIVQPDLAVFGEKDWQQLTIIRRMVHDLCLPVDVVAAPIAREADGLAMSSRNRYLSTTQRQQATVLNQVLCQMHAQCQHGEQQTGVLIDAGRCLLHQHGLDAEYLEVRDENTLQAITTIGQQPARAFIAARLGNTRLIDTTILRESAPCN
ncbi:MAG: pantoate--beta-alanine ligase, partial [Mariprofundaceae bacterium]|nr:pantoate--beta-alanine ligase [Mariprofundaceae bacterium]